LRLQTEKTAFLFKKFSAVAAGFQSKPSQTPLFPAFAGVSPTNRDFGSILTMLQIISLFLMYGN
jgi:hypothetical protein